MDDNDAVIKDKIQKLEEEFEGSSQNLETEVSQGNDTFTSNDKFEGQAPVTSSHQEQNSISTSCISKDLDTKISQSDGPSKEANTVQQDDMLVGNHTDLGDANEQIVNEKQAQDQESRLGGNNQQHDLTKFEAEKEPESLNDNADLPVKKKIGDPVPEVESSEIREDAGLQHCSKSLQPDEMEAGMESKKSKCSDQGDNGTRQNNTQRFDQLQSLYHLKKFRWKGELIQIVTQNENGPCPLLAIANVLVLSKRIILPIMQECITATQLMEYIGDYILTVEPKNVDESVLLNYQQNMHDAISIMYKLQTGIDVNVKFTGPRDFELTPECLVFDILNIGLYHGWLVDPQDSQIVHAVGSLSYNQLVEKIIRSKEENSDENTLTEGLAVENFLDQTASQLTYHGLCELNSATKEGELCVFFRNNHFNTLYKFKDELFLLVTDQGYLTESKIIWETLANVDGDGQFVDENFVTVGPMTYQPAMAERNKQTPTDLTQEDRDYLIALSLQEENQTAPAPEPVPISPEQQEAKE
eukprot:gene12616-3320_t